MKLNDLRGGLRPPAASKANKTKYFRLRLRISNISLFNIREVTGTKKSAEKCIQVHFFYPNLETEPQNKKKQE